MGLYPGSEFKLAADPTGTDPAALAAGTWPAFLTDNAIYHRIATPVEDQLTHFKMEPNQDDLAAQEAAAREYQPDLAVSRCIASPQRTDREPLTQYVGTPCRREDGQ